LDILHRLEKGLSNISPSAFGDDSCTLSDCNTAIPTKLVIGTAPQGTPSRGAGYARNQAVKLRDNCDNRQNHTQKPLHHFLCILDSDDIMHPTRVAEQTFAMMSLGYDKDGAHLCQKTLMGCQFDRIPTDSTWHYQNWANSLTDERVYLEKFRECTFIQPTWFMARDWFDSLGGYLEAPVVHGENRGLKRKLDDILGDTETQHYQLIHPTELTQPPKEPEKSTLRLAEDLRLWYTHLRAGGKLHLHRTSHPLVSYRHRSGMSQSSGTPRKLLLKLRATAWEDLIYYGNQNNNQSSNSTIWSKNGFAIWGAGRDGKDFLKALSPQVASSVVCFVDVDKKKIDEIKWYDNPGLGKRIPIWHFSVLQNAVGNGETATKPEFFGRIDKRKENAVSHLQNQQVSDNNRTEQQLVCTHQLEKNDVLHNNLPISKEVLANLPVVVCVAMYRTNGAMESNVASIGRKEGETLWHIC
jgi:hypothetical protein